MTLLFSYLDLSLKVGQESGNFLVALGACCGLVTFFCVLGCLIAAAGFLPSFLARKLGRQWQSLQHFRCWLAL